MRTGIAIVLSGLLAQAAPAQPHDPCPPNAGIEYLRAALLLAHPKEPDAKSPLEALDWATIGANLDPTKMPPQFEEARKELPHAAIAEFIRAGSRERCDFQLDLAQGPEVLLPHLSPMRTLARATRLDARALLMDGKPDDAAERVAAIIEACGHIGNDGTMISSLVAVALAKTATDEIDTMVTSERLTAAGRDRLLAAIHRLDANDPAEFIRAIQGERRISVEWFRSAFPPPGGARKFAKKWAEFNIEGQAAGKAPDERMSKVDDAAFAALIKMLDDYYADAIAAWTSPDPQPKLREIEQKMDAGKYGLLAGIMAPALLRARESATKGKEALDHAAQVLAEFRPAQ